MWPERKVTEPELQELHLALAASEIPPGLDRIVRELLEECRGYREALARMRAASKWCDEW